MTSRQPIYGLDLARFAAAAMVMAYHLLFKTFAAKPAATHMLQVPHMMPPWWPVTWFGWIGVQIFFVISGLVIAYSARSARPWSFVVGRIARLLPGMALSAALCAAIDVIVFDRALGHTAYLFVRSILFVPTGPWIAGQIWTLPIEIMFYAIIWIMVVLRRVDDLDLLAWALALASAAYWIAISGFGLSDPISRITQIIPFQHGCYFALGIALAALDSHGRSPGRLALIVLCLLTALPQVAVAARWETVEHGLAGHWPIAYAIFIAAIAFIGWSLFAKDRIAARIGPSTAPTARLSRAMGLITYPLYLIHMHVGAAVASAGMAAGLQPLPAILLGMVACVIAAWIISTTLEPPLAAAIKRLAPGKRHAA